MQAGKTVPGTTQTDAAEPATSGSAVTAVRLRLVSERYAGRILACRVGPVVQRSEDGTGCLACQLSGDGPAAKCTYKGIFNQRGSDGTITRTKTAKEADTSVSASISSQYRRCRHETPVAVASFVNVCSGRELDLLQFPPAVRRVGQASKADFTRSARAQTKATPSQV